MFNAKCLLILTLLASVICFGCNDRTSQMMKLVVEDVLVEEPVWMYLAASDGGVLRATNDGTNLQHLVTGTEYLRGIDLDVTGGKMYWSSGSQKIQRANLDGSNVEDVITGSRPWAIALDIAGGKVYWTNNSPGKIHRANLDGSNVEDLVLNGSASTISGIALDVANRKMYWTADTWDEVDTLEFEAWAAEVEEDGVIPGYPVIKRANLDGSHVEDIMFPGVYAADIALDVANGKMYWTAQASGSSLIQRANLDGSNVEDVITGLSEPSAIALDVASGKMYWSSGSQKIQRANLDGSHVEDIIFTGTWVHSIALGISQPSGPGLGPVAEEPEEVDVPANGILVYVDPEQITSPAVGEHLQVSIQIAHAADVVGYQFTLEFDPTALRYVESSHADYLPGVIEIDPVVSENSVLMAAALESGAAGASSGTLATLTFEVIAAKASTLTLSEVILSNSKAERLPLTTENGEISAPFVPDEPVDEPLVEEPERQFTPFEGLTISDDGTVSLIVGRAEMHAGPGRCIFFDNSSLNGIRYDVHDFFWAYRADDNSDFRAIEGTESDQGICGYKALTEPGQYRVFLDFSMNGNRHDAVSQNVIEIK